MGGAHILVIPPWNLGTLWNLVRKGRYTRAHGGHLPKPSSVDSTVCGIPC